MGCSLDAYRSTIGLFAPVLMEFLGDRAKKAAKHLKETKLRTVMKMLAVVTLLSLLVRAGVERNPGPSDMDHAMEKLYDRIDARLDRTESKIVNISEEVRHLSSRFDFMEERIGLIEESADIFNDKLNELEDKVEHLEIYSRRENMIFRGIKENENENPETCRQSVLSCLRQCAPSKEWSDGDILRAHRLGKPLPSHNTQSARPRPVIVRFKLWQDKMSVVANRTVRETLRLKSITVDDDLTKRQRDTLNSLKDEGRYGFYRGDRLITQTRRNISDTYDRHDNRKYNRNTDRSQDNRSRQESYGGQNRSYASNHRTRQNSLGRRNVSLRENSRQRSSTTDNRTYSQAVKEGTRDRRTCPLPSASGQNSSGDREAPSSSTASRLSYFAYSPRSRHPTPHTRNAVHTEPNDTQQQHTHTHSQNTDLQLTDDLSETARAEGVEGVQGEKRPAKRPRQPSSPSVTEDSNSEKKKGNEDTHKESVPLDINVSLSGESGNNVPGLYAAEEQSAMTTNDNEQHPFQ